MRMAVAKHGFRNGFAEHLGDISFGCIDNSLFKVDFGAVFVSNHHNTDWRSGFDCSAIGSNFHESCFSSAAC